MNNTKIDKFIEQCGQIFKNHQVWSEDKLEYVLLQSDYNSIIKDLNGLMDSKWISVKDELPKIEAPKDYRIAWIIFDGDIVTYTTQHPDKWNKDGNKITHWQPRPQPPEK